MESKKVLGRVFEGPRSDRFHGARPEAGQFHDWPLFFHTYVGVQSFWVRRQIIGRSFQSVRGFRIPLPHKRMLPKGIVNADH
jgi:hypothetical protein